MKRAIAIIAPLLLLLFVIEIGAQEAPDGEPFPTTETVPPFILGDQYFGIHAGVYVPLFLVDPERAGIIDTKQSVGGYAAFEWNIYLNSFFTIGIETAYTFSFTANDRTVSLWPTLIQFGFAPRVGQFLIPVHIDIGLLLSYLGVSTKADLALRGGIGFYWFFDPSWAIGINADYYFLPQIYTGTLAPSTDTRLLNATIISLGVIYRI